MNEREAKLALCNAFGIPTHNCVGVTIKFGLTGPVAVTAEYHAHPYDVANGELRLVADKYRLVSSETTEPERES